MPIPVVIFDGECGLCNRLIRLLIRADRHGVFRICAGKSEAGTLLISRANLAQDITAKTIVVVRGDQVWTHSSAVIYVATFLAFPWNVLSCARLAPKSWRDAVYRVIARHRRRLKHADPACGMPPRALRETWMKRLAQVQDLLDDPDDDQEFSFDFDPLFRRILWLFGIDKDSAFVRIGEEGLLARFGLIWVQTSLDNIASAELTGPYRWYRAIGIRGSWVDKGLTFGSTTRGGVCVCFRQPVTGLGRHPRHPGLTVTVENRERFAEVLDHLIDNNHG